MASHFVPDRDLADVGDFRSPMVFDHLPEELLAPIFSGAYVRGIADTLELLGLPGVFLDHDGRVLFANASASRRIGQGLRIGAHHLVADESGDNLLLSRLIAAAIGTAGATHDSFSAKLTHPPFVIHALPVGDRLAASGQLLRAILLIDDGLDPVISMLVRSMVACPVTRDSLSAEPQEND